MDKKKLEQVSESIIKTIDNSDIGIVDKVELMNNVSNFLDSDKYENNLKKLNRSDD